MFTKRGWRTGRGQGREKTKRDERRRGREGKKGKREKRLRSLTEHRKLSRKKTEQPRPGEGRGRKGKSEGAQ